MPPSPVTTISVGFADGYLSVGFADGYLYVGCADRYLHVGHPSLGTRSTAPVSASPSRP